MLQSNANERSLGPAIHESPMMQRGPAWSEGTGRVTDGPASRPFFSLISPEGRARSGARTVPKGIHEGCSRGSSSFRTGPASVIHHVLLRPADGGGTGQRTQLKTKLLRNFSRFWWKWKRFGPTEVVHSSPKTQRFFIPLSLIIRYFTTDVPLVCFQKRLNTFPDGRIYITCRREPVQPCKYHDINDCGEPRPPSSQGDQASVCGRGHNRDNRTVETSTLPKNLGQNHLFSPLLSLWAELRWRLPAGVRAHPHKYTRPLTECWRPCCVSLFLSPSPPPSPTRPSAGGSSSPTGLLLLQGSSRFSGPGFL